MRDRHDTRPVLMLVFGIVLLCGSVDASAQVATRLTQSCKSIRILATSRERLGVPGELTWQVPPMRLPGAELPLGGRLEDFMGYEGIRLFVDRAVAAKSGFAVSAAKSACAQPSR